MAIPAVAQTDTEHVRLTNLPHIYINTFNGRPVTSKTTMVYSKMWYVDEQDVVTFYDSLQIRIRGNSTADLAKKPYKLKFNTKEKFLGKGYAKTKKWTLLANHGDKTLLRNALTSLMGEFAGLKFNPAAKFVDLTLNGKYVGNYQISDQVDVRPHRVNVAEQDYPLTATSDITGGYLLEADGFQDFLSEWNVWGSDRSPTGFYTYNKDVPIRIHYPDEDEIDRSQYEYIEEFVNDFEERLFSSDFTDPEFGYRPMVDSVSLVNWYICTEVSANVDGFFSTYFYKHQDDDHLYWGPLWDYDIAYNNDNRTDRGGTSNTEQQLMKDYGYGGSGSGCRSWMRQMWKDPWFARLVNRRYKQLVDAGLEQYLNEKLDSLTTLIDASQQLNYERWGINTQTLRERVLHTTYNGYVQDVRTFINRHMAYLTQAFAELLPDAPEPDPEVKIPDFIADSQSYYRFINAGSGTCIDINAENDEICGNTRDTLSESQQWHITNLTNGYLFIVNRATGQALSDPSPEGSTATTNTGSTIQIAKADSTDIRQQWDLVSRDEDRYNIVSRWSQHAANLSGGSWDDGTPVLSYTSDERDAISNNRLWFVEKSGSVPNGIDVVPRQDYALAYNPQNGRLHFGADDLPALTFNVSIYNVHGHRVATFRAADGYDMNTLPTALYLISWKCDGRQHTVKLLTTK
jgi:spore coat protein CotH